MACIVFKDLAAARVDADDKRFPFSGGVWTGKLSIGGGRRNEMTFATAKQCLCHVANWRRCCCQVMMAYSRTITRYRLSRFNELSRDKSAVDSKR